MLLYKNCAWWKNFDCIFEFSVKSYVRNTINLSCAKILFPSVSATKWFARFSWNLVCGFFTARYRANMIFEKISSVAGKCIPTPCSLDFVYRIWWIGTLYLHLMSLRSWKFRFYQYSGKYTSLDRVHDYVAFFSTLFVQIEVQFDTTDVHKNLFSEYSHNECRAFATSIKYFLPVLPKFILRFGWYSV
jgi:hypothetical protein